MATLLELQVINEGRKKTLSLSMSQLIGYPIPSGQHAKTTQK